MDNYQQPIIIAGTAIGISKSIVALFQAPFKRAMTILQTQGMIQNIQTPYRGVLSCVKILYKEQGFKSLWRGVFPELISIIPKGIIPIIINKTLQKITNNYDPSKETTKFFASKMTHGILISLSILLVSYPLDVIKIKLQTDMGRNFIERKFVGLTDCSNRIYQKNGFSGFYKGFSVKLMGVGVYRSIYFGLYDGTILLFNENTSFVKKYIVAQIITLFAGVVTYPLDTIRKRLAMQAGRSKIIYTGIYDCMSTMVKAEGVRSLFRGFPFQVGMSVFTSLGLVVYSNLTSLGFPK